MLNMRLRSFFEHVLFAFGTAFTCFVILISSTLQARTAQFAYAIANPQALNAASDLGVTVSTSNPDLTHDVRVHRGMIFVEAMLPKQPAGAQDICFEDTNVRSCEPPRDTPFDSAPSEFLPASLELPTLNLV